MRYALSLLTAAALGIGAGAEGVGSARAELKTAAGQAVGVALMTETPHGVLIRATIEGAPAGDHAFHVHTTGKCDAPDFQTAGGHFNPATRHHGFLAAEGPHAGDMPNLHVPDSGRLTFETMVPGVTLGSGLTGLMDADGAALIVHAAADDYKSDPAGAAGARWACGVVSK